VSGNLRYYPLRKKDLNRLKELVRERFPGLYKLIEECKIGYKVVSESITVIAFSDLPVLAYVDSDIIPTLVAVKLSGIDCLPHAVVDEGAVKHLLNGADVMAPGIVEVTEFRVGDVVSVWNPDKSAPLVVGKALMSSSEIVTKRRGKAIENLHYAGDKVWKLSLQFIQQVRSK